MKTNDEIIPRIEANFGRGEIAITTGTHGGRPCVYLAPARMPAAVGAPVSNAAEGLPSDAMREDESVLTFPTAEQAELVKRALAGQLTTVDKPGEVVAFRIVGKHGPYPWVDGKPDPEPEFIVGEWERLELAYGQPLPAGVPDGWLPIETAPKGEKVIAGYRNLLGIWRSIMARYYMPGTLELADDADDTADGYAPEGWYEATEAYEEIRRTDEEPTHWMPLAAAPAPVRSES